MEKNLYIDASHPNETRVVLKSGENIEVWGTGNARREFMYVKDLASALCFVMNLSDNEFFFNDKLNNSHINIGTGKDVSIKNLINILSKLFNIKGKILFNSNMPEGVNRKLLDIKKIESLGWAHKISLEKGLAKTIEYYRKNF